MLIEGLCDTFKHTIMSVNCSEGNGVNEEERRLVIYNIEKDGYITVDNVGRAIFTENVKDAKLFHTFRDVANFLIDNHIRLHADLTIIYAHIQLKVWPDFSLNLKKTVEEEIEELVEDGESYEPTDQDIPLLNPQAARKVQEERRKKRQEEYNLAKRKNDRERMVYELNKKKDSPKEYDPNDLGTNKFL